MMRMPKHKIVASVFNTIVAALIATTLSSCNREVQIDPVGSMPQPSAQVNNSKTKSLPEEDSLPEEVKNILQNSDYRRQSEGAPPIKLLWGCDTEKELLTWGRAANVHLEKRYRIDETSSLLILLGEEGSGISRKTIYVYLNNVNECRLLAVRPTTGSKVDVQYDQAKQTLTFWSSSTYIKSSKRTLCLVLPL